MATSLTINEALIWMKTLRERHLELVQLRNQNATRETRYLGEHADKSIVKEPVYDVKVLDQMISRLAREMRMLDMALKRTNASTTVQGYEQNEEVLGQLT